MRLLPAIFTQDVALFQFRGTRKMCVAEEVFGEGDHIGVLVRDRFSRYDNSFKGKQQYCFEHLKRDCKELLEWAVGGSGDSPRVVNAGQRGQSPCGPRATVDSGDSPLVVHGLKRSAKVEPP